MMDGDIILRRSMVAYKLLNYFMNYLNSVFGHESIALMAADRGCPYPMAIECGLVYYTSESIHHGAGKWQYITWDKTWNPAVDPEAIATLQRQGILPADYVIQESD